MTLRRKTAIILAALFYTGIPIQVNVSADTEVPDYMQSEGTPDSPNTVNLIVEYSRSLTAGSGKLYLDTLTKASQTMAEIGVIDLEVQYSMDGLTGWTPLLFPSDQVNTDSKKHELDDFEISVFHGRFYRVVLTHYALEYGWLSPDSQYIQRTTNCVWVP